jgi:hypothetical protein
MARKTVAEKRAEMEALEAARQAREAQEYLPRLMAALERATNDHNYELLVRDGMFVVNDRDTRGWNELRSLSPNYSRVDFDNLTSLEWDLQMKDEEKAEARRRAEVRANALSKLTSEEKELLGL